ncbi:heat shock factor protein 5 [Lithobates pipiens]
MAVEHCNLPAEMSPHCFPAKLWRIVNDPHYRSMRWDPRGEGIVIDQEFFEAEILVRRGIPVPKDMFKVTSFGSFIRQLNLYGFRKLGFASGDSGHHVGRLGDGDRSLHHFCNDFFHRDHPELLFNLKRLTNINKAKMAAGFTGNARPQNRYPRILPCQVVEQRGAKSQVGLMPLEQNKHFPKQENISLYPYAGPVSQSHSASSIKEFVDMPVSTKMLPSSFGPHQGYLSVHHSPSPFPERPAFFPLIQQVPTQVAYTLQSSATSLHVQQGHSVMMESVQNYGSSLSMQYPSAYYPAAMFQGYPPSYMEDPSNFSNPVLLYNPYYQGTPVQAPYLVEFYNPNLPRTNYNDFRRDQANLNTAFWVADDMQASRQPEMAQLDVQVNHKQPLSLSNYAHVPETFEHGQTQQLQYILPVNMDITNCAARSYQAAAFSHTQALGGAYPSSSNTERPLMQPPCPIEVFHPYVPNTNCADFSRAQVNLDTAVQVVDDLQASHQPKMAQLDVQENHKEPLSSSNDGHVPETVEHSQAQQLECLLPVNMDITNSTAKSYQAAPFLHTQASDVLSFKQYH